MYVHTGHSPGHLTRGPRRCQRGSAGPGAPSCAASSASLRASLCERPTTNQIASTGSAPAFSRRCGREDSKAIESPGAELVLLVEADGDAQAPGEHEPVLAPHVAHVRALAARRAADLVDDVEEVGVLLGRRRQALPAHARLELDALARVAALHERGARLLAPPAVRRRAPRRPRCAASRTARRATCRARRRSRTACPPTAASARSRSATARWARSPGAARARAGSAPWRSRSERRRWPTPSWKSAVRSRRRLAPVDSAAIREPL